ncbi:class III lanthipeptide [Staphylococcus felis]
MNTILELQRLHNPSAYKPIACSTAPPSDVYKTTRLLTWSTVSYDCKRKG